MSTGRALHLVDADDEDDLDDWDLPDGGQSSAGRRTPLRRSDPCSFAVDRYSRSGASLAAVPGRRRRRCVHEAGVKRLYRLTIPSAPPALPSQAHPSYPYGNPYKNHAFAPTSSGSTTGRTRPSSSAHHLSPFAHPLTHSASLATTLPALELRHLFERTTFGDPLDRQWPELNLAGMFGPKTRVELEEDRKSRDALYNTHGDAGAPAGQNAAAGGGEPDPDDGEIGQGAGGGANGGGAAQTQEEVREVAAGEPMQDDGQ